MKIKIIVVTGGVYSSLGKGVVASSIGRILADNNFKVSMQKFDPYLNVDSGSLSPVEHGEVYVTKDGGETDLDLGHYERFINYELSKYSSITSGAIFNEVITNQRNLWYKGETVQIIPHITDAIEAKIRKIISLDKPDFLIIEIGGTAGDIESLPFIEAQRIFSTKYGLKNFLFIHCSPLVQIPMSKEIKTKPTQQSVRILKNLGIIPNMLVLRSTKIVSNEDKKKIELTCSIDSQNIFTSVDSNSIYDVPKILYDQGIAKAILKHFNIKNKKLSLNNWSKFLYDVHKVKKYYSKVAIVGKYTSLTDAYLSIIESLKLSAYKNDIDLKIDLIESTILEQQNPANILKDYDGILIAGGFGKRGIEGKINAAQYARENNIPFFGVCLGMQIALIEIARHMLNFKDANSTEFNCNTNYPIFDFINGTRQATDLRLGNFKIIIKPQTLANKIYGVTECIERHRHRFNFNFEYKEQYEKQGVVFSAMSVDNKILEMIELKNHCFFIGVQFHPEFLSKPNNPHPIFNAFVKQTIFKKD